MIAHSYRGTSGTWYARLDHPRMPMGWMTEDTERKAIARALDITFLSEAPAAFTTRYLTRVNNTRVHCIIPALDGHLTCGDVRCDEQRARDARHR